VSQFHAVHHRLSFKNGGLHDLHYALLHCSTEDELHWALLQVTLSVLHFFDHGRSCTLWLEPTSQGLKDLQERLVRAFPDCTDLSVDSTRGIADFTPHLSLGQWSNANAVSQAQEVQTSHVLHSGIFIAWPH
jgi:hypothetical protein